MAILIVGLMLAPALAVETKLMTLRGKVTSVDPAASTFAVTSDEKPGDPQSVTFTMTNDSKVTRAGAQVQLDKIAVGDPVAVSYRTIDGKNVVVSIVDDAKS
jgi:hypothetical protein